MTIQYSNRPEPLEGELIYPVPQISYESPMKIPKPPHTEIERTGFMGLQQDGLDTDSKRRKKELHHAAVETSFRRMAAMALDAASHQVVTQGISKIEAHHSTLNFGSLAAKVSEDIGKACAGRQVLGVVEDGELYTSISNNILLSRRR